MVKKYPLLRGKGKNKSVRDALQVITIDKLNKFKDAAVVDGESLVKMNLIRDLRRPVKILVKGKLERKLTVKIPASSAAKKIIEAAGGKVLD